MGAMKILGVDPGSAIVGWGIIETVKGKGLKSVSYDCIKTEKSAELGDRLRSIHTSIDRILVRFRPAIVSVEELYFSRNVSSALQVAHARGVILLASSQRRIPVISYAPRTVKLTVCGTGSADKKQVQRMVARILHLPNLPSPDDIADALALAITHAYNYRFKEITA